MMSTQREREREIESQQIGQHSAKTCPDKEDALDTKLMDNQDTIWLKRRPRHKIDGIIRTPFG